MMIPGFKNGLRPKSNGLDGIDSFKFPLSSPLCEVSRDEAKAYLHDLDHAKEAIVASLLAAARRSGLPAEGTDCFDYAGVLAAWIADNSSKSRNAIGGF
jgi:hypothetical protein